MYGWILICLYSVLPGQLLWMVFLFRVYVSLCFFFFCPVKQQDQYVFVSEFVNSTWVKKKQYRLNSVVLMVCTLCKYLNIFFDSMRRCISIQPVYMDISQLEPKQKRKCDIICKVTLYSQLISPISILYI